MCQFSEKHLVSYPSCGGFASSVVLLRQECHVDLSDASCSGICKLVLTATPVLNASAINFTEAQVVHNFHEQTSPPAVL